MLLKSHFHFLQQMLHTISTQLECKVKSLEFLSHQCLHNQEGCTAGHQHVCSTLLDLHCSCTWHTQHPQLPGQDARTQYSGYSSLKHGIWPIPGTTVFPPAYSASQDLLEHVAMLLITEGFASSAFLWHCIGVPY